MWDLTKNLLFGLILLTMTPLVSLAAAGPTEPSAVQQGESPCVAASGWSAVADDVLDSQRGGQETLSIDQMNLQMNTMNLEALMKQNSLQSSGTGVNSISSDALSNVSGIATVIQNSGNQVIINNAMILNLFLN